MRTNERSLADVHQKIIFLQQLPALARVLRKIARDKRAAFRNDTYWASLFRALGIPMRGS
jgi:hypothetical protein